MFMSFMCIEVCQKAPASLEKDVQRSNKFKEAAQFHCIINVIAGIEDKRPTCACQSS